jgi:pyruvate,water dikinase
MKYLIKTDDISSKNRNLVGDKAYNIALLKQSGVKVPESIALTTSAYKKYMHSSGMDAFILRELKRKKIQDYRWEELWDISLRVKNAFVRKKMPTYIENEIESELKNLFNDKPVAVRSSAPGEDGLNSSFAGLHESYINLKGKEEILKHIRLVWASLWSVSALLYRKELDLDPFKSSMSVLIQEVINGDCSGVAFSQSPEKHDCSMVEAVHGLNQGMVDGTVEPDRWNVGRTDQRIHDFFPASERKKVVKPTKNGIKLVNNTLSNKNKPPLENLQVLTVAGEAMRQEKYFGHPRDTEWTFRTNELTLLQSRPITQRDKTQDSRKFYDNLLVSFDKLRDIEEKLEAEILPDMLEIARKWKKQNLKKMDNQKLINCLTERAEKYRRCLKDYEIYCIPFAHGVRLFGEVYNTKIQPEDPYEFVELLRTDKLLSLERNQKISLLAGKLAGSSNKDSSSILKDIASIFGQQYGKISEIPDKILNLLKNYNDSAKLKKQKNSQEKKFINSFDDEQKNAAHELLRLGQASYRLRDDDNIYLDGVKNGLNSTLEEADFRLQNNLLNKKEAAGAVKELEKGIPELHSPAINQQTTYIKDESVKYRQLTGQPAGKGIAQGKVRIIEKFDDLYDFQKGEILVCDAIEPEMTIVAPLAAAVIERRGGMLIHGAIIAREYGLPCVTGIPQLTEKVKNGDLVSVDGWLGIVTIL